MLSQFQILFVQAATDSAYQEVQESYDSVAQLIKLLLIVVVILIVLRFVMLVMKANAEKHESDLRLLNMQADMQEAARKKIAARKGNGKDLDEVK